MSSLTLPAASRHPMKIAALTLAVALAAGVTLTAVAAPPRGEPGAPMMPMMGHPAHVERLLDEVGASADQKQQVKAILDAAQADLKADRDAGRALMDQTMQLFTEPTVDARAAEALRQQMLARHDQASKRMLQAMLDVSRVLTPDQRKQMAAKMAERRSRMERHHGGGAPGRPAN